MVSPQLYHVMANSSIEILDADDARHQSYAQTVRSRTTASSLSDSWAATRTCS